MIHQLVPYLENHQWTVYQPETSTHELEEDFYFLSSIVPYIWAYGQTIITLPSYLTPAGDWESQKPDASQLHINQMPAGMTDIDLITSWLKHTEYSQPKAAGRGWSSLGQFCVISLVS